MSDQDLFVNYAHCTNVYEAYQNANNQINQIMERVLAVTNGLKDSWIGLAPDAWSTLQAKYQADMATMNAALKSNMGTLDEITFNYNANDQAMAAQWQNIG